MENRHAYLIMFHQNIEQLKILLHLLDYELNDIYIHADKKLSLSDNEKNKISSILKKSNCFFIKSRYGAWGGDSLMKIEIDLLKKATEVEHKYYHLLSGTDLPLKSQSYIHNLLKNDEKDHFRIRHEALGTDNFLNRVRYYCIFQNFIGRNYDCLLIKARNGFVRVQKRIGVDRTKKAGFEFVKSDQWFSITHNTAIFILKQYPLYKKYFLCSFVPDESFMCSIIKDSPLIDNLVNDSLRLIDWNRGEPYTFGKDDYDELINSSKLFARKFDIDYDREIVDKISEYVLNYNLSYTND